MIYLLEIDQQDDVERGINTLMQQAPDNYITQDETKELSLLVYELKNIFTSQFRQDRLQVLTNFEYK